MAPATEKWTAAHTRLRKRMQWNAVCLAGLSISEQNHKTELGLRSMTKYKELIDTADILTLPGLLRCEIPELDDWERIKEDAKKWADLEPKDGKLNYSRVSSIRN